MLIKPIFFGFLALFCISLSCASPSHHRPYIIKSLDNKAPKSHQALPTTQISKTIYVDDNFTDGQRMIIQDAADEWEMVSNGLVKFNLEYDYQVKIGLISHKIVIVDLDPNDAITLALDEKNGETFLAGHIKQYDVEYVLVVADRIDDPYFLKVAMERQLGKILGMKDVPNERPAIMNPIANPKVPCPDRWDVEEMCIVMLCSPDEMSYCRVRE